MNRCLSILFFVVFAVTAQENTPNANRTDGRSAAGATGSTNRPQYNFLFVVDTSLSMGPRKAAAIKMVRDVITSGFNGQIEPGDSIDIWTYDSENHIGRFPPYLWEHVEVHRIAAVAARFLEHQKFKGRSQFMPVAADLELLLPHTMSLLTVIITDAEPPVAGINLDLTINEHVAKEKLLKPRSKHPLLISLAATNGKFHDWTVYNGEGDLNLAALPTRPKPLPVVAEVIAQKAPEQPKKEPEQAPLVVIDYPPGTKITPILPPQPEPKAVEPLIEQIAVPKIETLATVGAESEDKKIVAATSAPPISTKPEVVVSIAEKEPAPAKVEIATKEPVAASITKAPEAKPEPQVSAASVSTPATPPTEKPISATPERIALPMNEVIKPSEPIVALTTPDLPTNTIYIAITTGLSFLAIGIFLLLRRAKSRHRGSIISRSLQL